MEFWIGLGIGAVIGLIAGYVIAAWSPPEGP